MSNLDLIRKFVLRHVNVNPTKKNSKTAQNTQNQKQGSFFGHIGVDVSYTVNWVAADEHPERHDFKFGSEQIKLIAFGKTLATVNVKNSYTKIIDKRTQIPSTLIQIYSPHYQQGGTVTKSIEAVNQLQIYHAPNETADEVINKMCDVIGYSLAKKKYSQLNLATRLVDAHLEKSMQ